VRLWDWTLDRFLVMGCYWTGDYRQTNTEAAANEAVKNLCQRPEILAALPDVLRTQALETAKKGSYTAAVAFLEDLPDRTALDAQLRTLASAALREKALARVGFGSLRELSELYQDENSQTFRDSLSQFQPFTESRQREGVWLLNRAKTIDPQFDLVQATQTLEDTLKESIERTVQNPVQSLIDRGDELARNNDRAGAVQRYNDALILDPKLDLNPEAQFERIQQEEAAQNLRIQQEEAAQSLVSEIQSLAQNGEIAQALAKLQTLETTYPEAIDSSTLNSLCWDGSLHNQAAQVLSLCDRAVALEPNNAYIQGRRGLARALTGDFAGAITDFQALVDSPDLREEYKDQGRQWIEALKAGNNPFTPEVLEALKR